MVLRNRIGGFNQGDSLPLYLITTAVETRKRNNRFPISSSEFLVISCIGDQIEFMRLMSLSLSLHLKPSLMQTWPRPARKIVRRQTTPTP